MKTEERSREAVKGFYDCISEVREYIEKILKENEELKAEVYRLRAEAIEKEKP